MTTAHPLIFDNFDDIPDTMYLLYFKNVSGTWSIESTIFTHKSDAEYIASFLERPTYIVPIETQTPVKIGSTPVVKVRMPKVKKVKVRKVKVPK